MGLSQSGANQLRTPTNSHRLPLIGPAIGFLRRPFHFLREQHAKHGDLYALNMGVAKIIMLNHPRHIQHVLVDHVENYRKEGSIWKSARVLFGNGLPVSEGDYWLRQRRMMQPHFHRKRLAGLTTLLGESIERVLQPWETHVGQPFDVAAAFGPMTMHVVTRLLFGQTLESAELNRVGVEMDSMGRYIFRGAFLSDLPRWIPKPGEKSFQQSAAFVNGIIYRLIAHERAVGLDEDTLLSMLVDMTDPDNGSLMTDIQLRDEVFAMFLAGYETTALTLTWAFHHLTHHPEILKQLQAEVDMVLGDRTPTFEDLPKLDYNRMVISETLRMHPPAWMLTRETVEDDEIDGYRIPAGATVLTSFYNVHHHPEFWENPDQFTPGRFTTAQIAERHRYAWVPFGAGKRMCIGKDLGVMEAQMMLAMICQRYSFTAKPSTTEAKLLALLVPAGPVTVTLERRTPILREIEYSA